MISNSAEVGKNIYLFENTLGGIDTVLFSGEFAEKINTESTITTVFGESMDSDIDFTFACEQNTGFIPSLDYARWLRGFFISKQRYHVTDATRLIYLRESENEFVLNTINDFTFEFFYSIQTKYNYVIRNNEVLPKLLEFPEVDNTPFLFPRLAEFPVAIVAEDLLLPVQFVYEERFRKLSVGGLVESLKTSIEGGNDAGKYFYEKDGKLYCRLDLIGEKGVSAYGVGPEDGGTGFDEKALEVYLATNKFTTETWVAAQGYLKSLPTHVHSTGDITSGMFSVERIPDLAISKIVGLSEALNEKQDSSSLIEFITKFNSMFELVDGKIKAKLDLYSVGGISAYGEGISGGGSGFDETTLEVYLTTNKYITETWVTMQGYLKTLPSHAHSWDSITGKPTVFTPEDHSHSWNSITAKPTSFIPANHSHAWVDITGKPTTFTPASHTHSIASVTGLQSSLDVLAARFGNYLPVSGKAAHVGLANCYEGFGAAYRSSSSSSSGILIKLPYGVTSGQMVCFTVRLYKSYQAYDIQFSGYLYNSSGGYWYNPKAQMIAGTTSVQVKMGYDTSKNAYVYIGNSSDYAGVAIIDIISGYTASEWSSGWVISPSTGTEITTINLDTTLYPLTSYLLKAGGDMSAGARISASGGNMYVGNANNGGWIGVQDMCSQASLGDGYWSIRTNGNAIFKTVTATTFTGNLSGTFNGLGLNDTTNNTANRVVRTDGNGYVNFGWINTVSGIASGTLTRVYCSQDAYLRYLSPANFISSLALATTVWVSANFNKYVHPTGAGNNHVPPAGASGQWLKWSSAGVATWATPATLTKGSYLTGSN
ncbi:MAG: hypothetical protein ACLUDU_16695, partial [Butyricimonas faecihominis]